MAIPSIMVWLNSSANLKALESPFHSGKSSNAVGESYLAALDGLFESGLDTIVGRNEGGVSMMAEAHAKLTSKRFYGRYGITGDPEWELWKVMNEELRAWAAKRNGNEGS